MAKARALFLDRDGVVNEERSYLAHPSEVHFVEGIFDLCRTARGLGYRLIVVTNQAGIARGIFSEAEFLRLMEWIEGEFVARGVPLDKYYYCPHHPVHGSGEYKKDCVNRKPGPGMLLDAARDFDLDLGRSLMVGDRCTDMQAAEAAGVEQRFLIAGTEGEGPGCAVPHRSIVRLDEVREYLLAVEASVTQ